MRSGRVAAVTRCAGSDVRARRRTKPGATVRLHIRNFDGNRSVAHFTKVICLHILMGDWTRESQHMDEYQAATFF